MTFWLFLTTEGGREIATDQGIFTNTIVGFIEYGKI
jgi:hypothetical protein